MVEVMSLLVENVFLQISFILLIVLGISFVMRILRQPLIIGYIISGVVVGPLFLNLLSSNETITAFSELGIAFLLFIVGTHLSPRVIKEVGKISFITGVGQFIFTALIGYVIGLMFGLSSVTSLYVSIALTFSSTIIVMKLLSDKEDLEKLYGKIAIGFLLVQDFIAIIVIMIVSSFSNGELIMSSLSFSFLKGILLIGLLIPIGYFVLPRLDYFFDRSQEFLFIFALAWGLGLSALFFYAGLSIEIGALIAGILLSMSPYNYEISSKLKPLRDFFIISFFILLGSQMIFNDVSRFILPIIVFSLFVIIGNPIILLVLMGVFGYDKKNSFLVGLSVAQISEFSWILILLGVRVGHLEPEILSLVTVIGMITIASSSYLITHGDRIYNHVAGYIPFFKRKIIHEKFVRNNYEYFLLGENRIWFSIMKAFGDLRKPYVVVDYNPERVKKLQAMGIPCLYGDVSDIEFLDDINIDKAKVVVSTIPDSDVNMILLRKMRKNKRGVVIVTARQISDAFDFYKAGADYVIMPHFLGGSYIAKVIEKFGNDKNRYIGEKKKHIRELRERLGEGHEHPHVNRHGK